MINVFDLFVMVVTAGLAILGFREGLVRGAIKLIGFVTLILLLVAFMGSILDVAGTIRVLPQTLTVLLAVVIILVVGMIVIHLVAKVLYELVHMTPAGFLDYGLGSAFGILKSLLLCGLLAIVLSLAPRGSFFRLQYEQSVSAEYLVRFMSDTIPFVKKMITPYYHRIMPEPENPEQNEDERSSPPNYI